MAPRGSVALFRHQRLGSMVKILSAGATAALRAHSIRMTPDASRSPRSGRALVAARRFTHATRPAGTPLHSGDRLDTPVARIRLEACNNRRNTSCNIRRHTVAVPPLVLRTHCASTSSYDRHISARLALLLVQPAALRLRVISACRAHTRALELRMRSAVPALALRRLITTPVLALAELLRTTCALVVAYWRECHAILAPMYPLMLHSHRAAPAHRSRPHSAATADAHSRVGGLS